MQDPNLTKEEILHKFNLLYRLVRIEIGFSLDQSEERDALLRGPFKQLIEGTKVLIKEQRTTK